MTLTAVTDSRPWLLVGWTMLHFLWVGALLGLAAAVLRRALRGARPEVRYGAAILGLAGLALSPALIASLLFMDTQPAVPRNVLTGATASSRVEALAPLRIPRESAPGFRLISDPSRPAIQSTTTARTALGSSLVAAAARGLPGLWLLGAPATFALLATGLIGAERLRRQSRTLTEGDLLEQCHRLAAALGVARPVALGVCDRLLTPVLLGVVRPLILLPTSALTGWSPEQVEMALLHELAHVRRLDNLLNLVQRTIEAVLFFHPAVWWLSAWVRLEREHCCDEVVIAHTGRARPYAELLATLAVTGASPGRAAVAMAEAPIVVRIRHILKLEDNPMRLSRAFVALVAGFLVAPAVLITSQAGPPDQKPAQKPSEPAPSTPPKGPADPRMEAIFRRALRGAEVFHDMQGRARAMSRIAAAQAQAGDRDAARQTFTQAVAIGEAIQPKESTYNPHILLWIAKDQARVGFRDEAIASMRKMLKIAEAAVDRESGKIDLLRSLVHAQAEVGDEEGIRETLRIGRLFYTRAKEAGIHGITPQSLVWMQAQSKDLAGAFRMLHDPELFQGPDAARSRHSALIMLVGQIQAGDEKAAAPILAEAVQALDANRGVPPSGYLTSRDQDLKKLAEAEARLGRFAEARKRIQAVDPENVRATLAKYPKLTESNLHHYLDLAKFGKAMTFATIGEEQAKAGDQAGARQSAEEVLRIIKTIHGDSSKGYPLSRASECLAKVGDFAKAIQIADTLKPNKQFAGYLAVAKRQHELGDKAGEQATLETALRRFRERFDALKPNESERHLNDSSEQNQLLEKIGRIQAIQGNLDAAIETIRRINEAEAESTALKTLARDRAAVNDLDGAMEVVGKMRGQKSETEALEAVLGSLPLRQVAVK